MPRRSPSRSAIQQRSRGGSSFSTNSAAMCATSASKRSSQPNSLPVELAVRLHDPAHVARAVRAQHERRGAPSAPSSDSIDSIAPTSRSCSEARQAREHGGDVRLRARGRAARRRAVRTRSASSGRWRASAAAVPRVTWPSRSKSRQDAAEVAGSSPRSAARSPGRDAGPVRELVEHARLRERLGRFEQAFLAARRCARV